MKNRILLTGPRPERATVERALYGGWTIEAWVESYKGFAALLAADDTIDARYQIGRLQSFGSWGVNFDPDSEDIIRAVGRARP